MALDHKALEKSMVHIMVFMYKTLNKHTQWLVIHDTLPCGCRSNSSHVKLPIPNCIQVIQDTRFIQICGNKPKVFWCLWGFG